MIRTNNSGANLKNKFATWETPSVHILMRAPLFSFSRDDYRNRGIDVVHFREISFVNRESDSASGIHVEQWLAYGHIHEGLHVGHGVGLAGDLDGDFIAELVSQTLKILAANVGDQAAEGIIEANHIAGNSDVGDRGLHRFQMDELGNIGPGQLPVFTGGKMRGGR